jgi:ATP-dependent Clp protease ATP-binding subunit ClpA
MTMFERFTHQAREAVVLAQGAAHELRHGYLGTEHLLLGLARQPEGMAGRILLSFGATDEAVLGDVRDIIGDGPPSVLSSADEQALRAIGVDVEAIRRRIEAQFGPGALDRPWAWRMSRRRARRGCPPMVPFDGGRMCWTPRAKKALELSLREALALRSGTIGTEHVLLGLAREGEGVAAMILARHGIDRPSLLAAIDRMASGDGTNG